MILDQNFQKIIVVFYNELMFIVYIEYLLQFLYLSNNLWDDIVIEVYEDELDMGRFGFYLNSSINLVWSEYSLDLEDIRVIIIFFFFYFS